MQSELLQKAESLIKSMGIPPQPEVVLRLLKKVQQENLDIQEIVNLVVKDVSLSAKTIKIANSPLFRKTRVESIHQAICMLGIKNFYAIIITASLEEALKVNKVLLNRFWQHSKITALACSLIAQRLGIVDESAYLLGLFHDVGVALMLNKYQDYQELQDFALFLTDISKLTDKYDTITGYESSIYNTNHAVLGYAMAKSWGIEDVVCQVILRHHMTHLLTQNQKEQDLLAILNIAEILSHRYDSELNRSNQDLPSDLSKISSRLMDNATLEGIYDELRINTDEFAF